MKIILANLDHLTEIIKINLIIDYGNPDTFMESSIKNGNVYVALEDEKVVGYSLYQTIWGNTPFLALVKVHPDFQGGGIGTALVDQTLQKIKNEGFSACLSSTEKKNILSQKFHKKLGFESIGGLDMPHGQELFYKKHL